MGIDGDVLDTPTPPPPPVESSKYACFRHYQGSVFVFVFQKFSGSLCSPIYIVRHNITTEKLSPLPIHKIPNPDENVLLTQ